MCICPDDNIITVCTNYLRLKKGRECSAAYGAQAGRLNIFYFGTLRIYSIPCPCSRPRIWSRETVSAVPSRVSLLISILRLDLVLAGFLSISAAASMYCIYMVITYSKSKDHSTSIAPITCERGFFFYITFGLYSRYHYIKVCAGTANEIICATSNDSRHGPGCA